MNHKTDKKDKKNQKAKIQIQVNENKKLKWLEQQIDHNSLYLKC